MPKEIPILFSTPMVEAIIAGRKSMTRRIVKPMKSQEEWLSPATLLKSPSAYTCIIDNNLWAQFRHPLAGQFAMGVYNSEDSPLTCIKHPYGNVGDLLWVRESYVKLLPTDENENVMYGKWQTIFKSQWQETDNDCWANKQGDLVNSENIKWRPSIHMLKSDARIWLRITGVRVEKANSISQEDAIREGVEFDYGEGRQFKNYWNNRFEFGDSRDSFKTLWLKINGDESWNSNPWVWVIEFEVVSTTGKPDSIPNPARSVATDGQSEKES